jgi:hypothetical protein
MRRICLTGILGLVALLTAATPAAAQGWGLGLFAKWSGPGEFHARNIRVPVFCGLDKNAQPQLKTGERLVDQDNKPIASQKARDIERKLVFQGLEPYRVQLPNQTINGGPQVVERRAALPAYFCLEYSHADLANVEDDRPANGLVTIERDEALFGWIPRGNEVPGKFLSTLVQFFEVGGGLGVRTYNVEEETFYRFNSSAELTVKLPNSLRSTNPWRTLLLVPRFVYMWDFFPTLTNEDLHVPSQFEHNSQHGWVVTADFSVVFIQR